MNQYKMCMGMWISVCSLIHINIVQEQQKDKKNQSRNMSGKQWNFLGINRKIQRRRCVETDSFTATIIWFCFCFILINRVRIRCELCQYKVILNTYTVHQILRKIQKTAYMQNISRILSLGSKMIFFFVLAFNDDALYLLLCHQKVGPKRCILPEMQSHQSAMHEPETGHYQWNLVGKQNYTSYTVRPKSKLSLLLVAMGHFMEIKKRNDMHNKLN